MEKLPSVKALIGAIIAIFFFLVWIFVYQRITIMDLQSDVSTMGSYLRTRSFFQNSLQANSKQQEVEVIQSVLEVPMSLEVVPIIVYDGMTKEELGAKLDRSLKSTLSGYGEKFADLSLKYGVDPYVAVAIVLLETGCNSGRCSSLVRTCNNVGGMKGSPGCGGGSYERFSSIDEGIEAFIKNLSLNYYQRGLTTVELIGKKYAESNTWATKVNKYISKIKAN